MMIPLSKNKAKILNLHVKGVEAGKDKLCRCRIQLEVRDLTVEDFNSLPFGSKALTAALTESHKAGAQDGPDTTSLYFKRQIAVMGFDLDFRVDKKNATIDFVGEVKNRVRVDVVMGKASMRFSVESLVPQPKVAALAGLVGNDFTKVTTQEKQLSLPGLKDAKAKGAKKKATTKTTAGERKKVGRPKRGTRATPRA